MKKGLTEVVFILDRSGSMSGLEKDTIGGYNSMLKKQLKENENGDVIISTILFDDRIEVLHDRKNIKEVENITENEYYVRGCTALLDAVGSAIHHIGRMHKEASPDEVPEKTLFIITTDGLENSSREYTYAKVKKMVEKKKKKRNWEFIFLGANIDAAKEAGKFGVAPDRAVRYMSDESGTSVCWNAMSNIVSCARKASSSKCMSEVFDTESPLEPVMMDYETRGK